VKRIPQVASIVAGTLVFIVAGLLGLALAKELFARTEGWDQPLTRDAAIAHPVVDYVFPASARDIYEFVREVGTQENSSFVRFTVDPSEVDSHIQDIARRRFGDGRSITPRKTLLSARTLHHPGWLPPPPRWWRVSDIHHGYAVTFGRDTWLTFWYDSDPHILYCYDVG
jgi:hypothetical protein